MKLIVSGATGLVATEVIRQSLSEPRIQTVLALSRRPVALPANVPVGADTSKLKTIIVDDFENYSDDVKKQIAGADACIWYAMEICLVVRYLILERARC
jgi:hypothetical protein